MRVSEFMKHLENLPADAEVLVAKDQADNFSDPVVRVDRLILNEGCRGSGGKVIAGIIRWECRHK